MIINVVPQRLLRAADELNKSAKTLLYTGYSIEQTIESLRHSDDESLLEIAAKLTKTMERLRVRIKVATVISTALERIAETYMRTEDRVVSYEDETGNTEYISYRYIRIDKVRRKASQTFERL